MIKLNKLNILVLCDWYLPGYKGGSLIRRISSMVEPFSNEFSFRILTSTRDRDVFEEAPYPNIKFNKWNKVGTIEDLCC